MWQHMAVKWQNCWHSMAVNQQFVRDFLAAWNKVMNLDCFDLA